MLKPVLGSQIQLGHPLARGLVGCWLMNEGSGAKVLDLSGNGNTGSLVADTHFVPGKFGSALDFDGTGDYVDCGNKSSLKFGATTNFTIEAWVKSSSANGTVVGCVDGGSTLGYIVRFLNGRIYIWLDDDVANPYGYLGTATFDDGIWHHLVVTFYRDGLAIGYKDGIQIGTLNISAVGNIDHAVSTKIGAYAIAPYVLFTGQIDHVTIYNRALSAQEVRQLYIDPFCMFEEEV